jgi:cysteine desulfuration protein SufE
LTRTEAAKRAEGNVGQRCQEVASEFEDLEGWRDRFEYLVNLAEEVPALAAEHRTDEYYVHSCQYDLWLRAEYDADANALEFRAYSDARITRGLAAMLVRLLDGQPPQAVIDAELSFLEEMGLRNQLSPQRENGLSGMIHEMKAQAESYADASANPGA